jgi:hypothetical protein
VESDAGPATPVTLAEVIIRHDDPPLVHRLAQILRVIPRSE